MPNILSSAPVLRDVNNGGGWSNTPRAMIFSHVTDDLVREEIDNSDLEAAESGQPHAQFDMPSASQTMTSVPDDVSSGPALYDVGTGGERYLSPVYCTTDRFSLDKGLDIDPEIADGDQSYAEPYSSDSSDDEGGVPLP